MKFRRINAVHAESECGRYVIARYSRPGGGAYQASKTGKPARSLHVARFQHGDEEGRRAAYHACVDACERDAEAS